MQYCCCLNRFRCTADRRAKQELQVFDTQPLLTTSSSPKQKQHPTPETIATLLYQFIRHELYSKNIRRRETHFLGSESNDEFRCLFCERHQETRYIQFEIDNLYFDDGRTGHTGHMGNQYIIQYVCVPCSKKLQPHLLTTIKQTETDIRRMQFLFLLHKLPTHPLLIQRILEFLGTPLGSSVLSLRAITYHRSEKVKKDKHKEDVSIWVDEKVIR